MFIYFFKHLQIRDGGNNMSKGWFCGVCFEDFEGDVIEHLNRNIDKVLCDKCKERISNREVANNETLQ
jgi:hypothetical protein